jgi:predicted dehydrogenase
MGRSHALAYDKMSEFQIVGLCSRSIHQCEDLPPQLASYPRFAQFDRALTETRPDAVSINTWPATHGAFCLKAFDAGCHVFTEKPLATTVEEASRVVDRSRAVNRKLVIGYILRVHPAWQRFIGHAQRLGKQLVMRMNLNQQSRGPAWNWHRDLMQSLMPIVDCGVHYVDVMCQMTGARPVRVHGIGARLAKDVEVPNYGHLHVVFDDGSVGWYEAGWGPMMSETAFFVKDVVGPKGSVSILVPQEGQEHAASDDIESHTKTNVLLIHSAEIDEDNNFVRSDESLSMDDEPDHQELCDREQQFFLKAIREDLDLCEHTESAVNSLRIVLAADESIRKGEVVHL